MTIQEALQNIDSVMANVNATRQQHQILQQSVGMVAQRCQLADRLEKENVRTHECPNLPGTDKEDSE